MSTPPALPRRLLAEALGTALLVATVVGSGIMAEQLAGGNLALALLANTLATVFVLYVLIEVLAPTSGAHFNPAVSLVMVLHRQLTPRWLAPYVCAQLTGAVAGVVLAHAMFGQALLQVGTQPRGGVGLWLAEVVATAGLLLVILRASPGRVAALVAAYIGAAYWFTASTSFANPAVTVGRMFSDSFAGIAPAGVPAFVAAQLAGALLGLSLHLALGRAPVAEAASRSS